MCLRKSPTRTPAFLAANRANAARSTGPRTPQGKRASAWNALRHGYRSRAGWAAEPHDARDAEAFEAFMKAFRAAVVPVDGEAAERSLRECVAPLWRTKRLLDHWLSRHPWPQFPEDPVPPPFLSLVFPRRVKEGGLQWWIKVSVSVRWGRSPVCMMIRDADPESAGAAWLDWRARRGSAHTVVTVTCTGHPWTRSHRQRLRTKPECHRKGMAWENVMDDCQTAGAGGERAPRDFGIAPASRPPRTARRAAVTGHSGRGAGNGWWTKIGSRLRALIASRRSRVAGSGFSSSGGLANEAGIFQKTGALQKCGAPDE
ncbi:MAG TPA: hypothetical protein VG206_13865 [Terriglobia bacterium]|nr:hypothetical protein [Terriglobia bacterium]